MAATYLYGIGVSGMEWKKYKVKGRIIIMPCQREENFAKRKLNNINGCGEKSGHLKQNRSFAAKKDDATTLPFSFVFLTFSTTTNNTEKTKNVKRVHKSPDFIGGFRWTSPGCSASSKLSPLRNSGQSSRRRRASGALHFSASQSSVLLFRVPPLLQNNSSHEKFYHHERHG